MSTSTVFISLWCELPRLCSEFVSCCQFPSLAPLLSSFSRNSFWLWCELWHHFVQILSYPALSQIQKVQGFYADDATSRLGDRILKINHQFGSFSSNRH